MKKNVYKCQPAQALIQTIGILFVTLMLGTFSVDAGLYYAVHRGMQNAADAAALAAAAELFRYTPAVANESISTRLASARASAQDISDDNMRNELNDADITFGYVDPVTLDYDPSTFTTPTTNAAYSATSGYNAVRVTVKGGDGQANAAVPFIFGTYLGLNNVDVSAQAVAVYGGAQSSYTGGVRPFYLCQYAWDQAKALYGDASVPTIRFYGSSVDIIGPSGTTNTYALGSTYCAQMPSGNWGLADFNGSGGGVPELTNNILYGYSGTVSVGSAYGPKTGNAINSSQVSNAIQTLITNGTIFPIPVYNSASGNGNNAQFTISQLAAFKLTGYQAQGNNSYIQGKFQKQLCHDNCTSVSTGLPGGGIAKIRLIH